MATYYAAGTIPTGQEVNQFNIAVYYYNTLHFGTIATLSALSSEVVNIENANGGNFTYQLIAVPAGTLVKLYWDSPTNVVTSFTFEDQTTADIFNLPFALVTNCTGCGSVEWAECEEDYTIDLGLTPSTSYNYTLTNGQTGIQYTQNSTTDGSGVTTWDTYLLPELYVSGNVFVLTATSGAEDVTFTYNGNEYSCMQITIVKQTNITD
jgi:hypothetical protein